ELAAGLEHGIGRDLNLTADGVEHDVTDAADLGEILGVVVDHAIGAEATNIGVVAGARRRDHARAEVLGELYGKSGNPAGATVNEDGLTCLEMRRVFNRPQRGEARKAESGCIGMA